MPTATATATAPAPAPASATYDEVEVPIRSTSPLHTKDGAVYSNERVLNDVKEGDLVISTDGSAASASSDMLSKDSKVGYGFVVHQQFVAQHIARRRSSRSIS